MLKQMIFRPGSQSGQGRGMAAKTLLAAFVAVSMAACGGGGGSEAAKAAPGITAQPQSLTVRSTQWATFSVSATGSPAPTFIWQKNGRDIAGETRSSFTIAGANASDVGTYRVIVRNDSGSVTSDPATLAVQTTLLFSSPTGVAKDGAGNVYVANSADHTICKVTPGGTVVVLAGASGQPGYADAIGSNARFSWPVGLALDGSGNVYVGDGNNTIRVVTPAGAVSTLAGSAGTPGSADGTGGSARFGNLIQGLAWDASGSLIVADTFNHTLRRVTPTGAVSTVAGLPAQAGAVDGAMDVAKFNHPSGVAVGVSGIIYVADYGNGTIRSVSTGGTVSTLVGTAGSSGSADGTGSVARFNGPAGIAVDGTGNLFVADSLNHTIRKVDVNGAVTTLAGTAGTPGNLDGTGAAARFNRPVHLQVDGSGTLLVADTSNGMIREVTSGAVATTLIQTGP